MRLTLPPGCPPRGPYPAPCSGWAPSGAPTFERSPELCMAPAGAGEMGSPGRRQSSLRPTHTCEHTRTVHAHGSEGVRTSRHTHTDVHTQVHGQKCTCVCARQDCALGTHAYTCTHVYTHAHSHEGTQVHTHKQTPSTQTRTHMGAHACTHVCAHKHTEYTPCLQKRRQVREHTVPHPPYRHPHTQREGPPSFQQNRSDLQPQEPESIAQ